MATLARSVIANEYSLVDDTATISSAEEVRLTPQKPDELSVGGVSTESGAIGGDSAREESPTSSSSSAEHFDPMVSSPTVASMWVEFWIC